MMQISEFTKLLAKFQGHLMKAIMEFSILGSRFFWIRINTWNVDQRTGIGLDEMLSKYDSLDFRIRNKFQLKIGNRIKIRRALRFILSIIVRLKL